MISDDDLAKADAQAGMELLHYAGWTCLSVLLFLVLLACFASDPKACIMAFGTGSPCCLLCPCYRKLIRFTDPSKLISVRVQLTVYNSSTHPSAEARGSGTIVNCL